MKKVNARVFFLSKNIDDPKGSGSTYFKDPNNPQNLHRIEKAKQEKLNKKKGSK